MRSPTQVCCKARARGRQSLPCGHVEGFQQELAEGRSLADLVASGWRADEAEVVRIARALLEVPSPPARLALVSVSHGVHAGLRVFG